jgi:hypothetical protein
MHGVTMKNKLVWSFIYLFIFGSLTDFDAGSTGDSTQCRVAANCILNNQKQPKDS